MSEEAASYKTGLTNNMIIYDCEIVKAIPPKDGAKLEGIEYCKGWRDFQNMGISITGCYDYAEDRYHVFCRDNFSKLKKLIDNRDIIIGFNSLAFDNRLCKANGLNVPDSKSYDLLVEVWKAKGLGDKFNPDKAHEYLGLGLDPLTEINLGQHKSGHGEIAPVQWQRGEIGAVIDYCLNDVRLTKQLIDKVIETGKLKDPHKNTKGQILYIRKPTTFLFNE